MTVWVTAHTETGLRDPVTRESREAAGVTDRSDRYPHAGVQGTSDRYDPREVADDCDRDGRDRWSEARTKPIVVRICVGLDRQRLYRRLVVGGDGKRCSTRLVSGSATVSTRLARVGSPPSGRSTTFSISSVDALAPVVSALLWLSVSSVVSSLVPFESCVRFVPTGPPGCPDPFLSRST